MPSRDINKYFNDALQDLTVKLNTATIVRYSELSVTGPPLILFVLANKVGHWTLFNSHQTIELHADEVCRIEKAIGSEALLVETTLNGAPSGLPVALEFVRLPQHPPTMDSFR